ncbi:hypothetical protein DSM25559_3968 [Agrobacterium rosae]|uniref:Uncharacterized protein n=1 Tax=Agrobacterium rosae TaxID=1972867 RepID=A0A1R3U714_9HYPH|nr:hypothetical protein DSM25559_3968 [Agrobacterium rosae]
MRTAEPSVRMIKRVATRLGDTEGVERMRLPESIERCTRLHWIIFRTVGRGVRYLEYKGAGADLHA